MSKKRANNEGSLYYSKAEKCWIAEISLPSGKRKKKRSQKQNVVKDWLLEQRKNIQNNLFISDDKISFQEFATRFLNEVVVHSVKPSTFKSYEYLINSHMIPELGHIKLSNLKPQHIQSMYSRKLESGLSKRTVQYLHSVLRRSLNHAVTWGLIVRNPTDAVTPPKPQRKEPKTLTTAQAQLFLESITDPRWGTIYIVAILMGLRKSEILGLRWQDVDFKNNAISINNIIFEIQGKIHQGTPKSERSRRSVAMPMVVVSALTKYQQITNKSEGLVFTTSSGKPISQRNLTRNFHGALKKVGLSRIRFHDLRHTAATLLLKENVHPKIVQEMLGHSTITLTLDTYSHVIPGMQKEAADKMDSLFKR